MARPPKMTSVQVIRLSVSRVIPEVSIRSAANAGTAANRAISAKNIFFIFPFSFIKIPYFCMLGNILNYFFFACQAFFYDLLIIFIIFLATHITTITPPSIISKTYAKNSIFTVICVGIIIFYPL